MMSIIFRAAVIVICLTAFSVSGISGAAGEGIDSKSLKVDPELARELGEALVSNDPEKIKELAAKDPKLLNAGIRNSQTALIWCAAKPDRLELIELLVKLGSDVNGRGYWGETPLHMAAWYRQQDVIKYLVENGALINAKDSQGNTPLDHYEKSGEVKNYAVKKYLTGAGAVSGK